jgi:hypothetical protein
VYFPKNRFRTTNIRKSSLVKKPLIRFEVPVVLLLVEASSICRQEDAVLWFCSPLLTQLNPIQPCALSAALSHTEVPAVGSQKLGSTYCHEGRKLCQAITTARRSSITPLVTLNTSRAYGQAALSCAAAQQAC